MVLPSASLGGEPWSVARSVAIDFLTVLINLAVVHVPVFVRNGRLFPLQDCARSLCADVMRRDLGIVLVYGALITLLAYSEGLFDGGSGIERGDGLVVLCKSVAWATLLLGVATRLSGGGTITGGMLMCAGVLNAAGMYGRRIWERRRNHSHASSREGRKRVLIVGAGPAGQALARFLNANPDQGRVVCGLLDDDCLTAQGVLGTVGDLARVARAEFADEVIVALPHSDLARRAITEALHNRLDVKVVPDLYGCEPARVQVERMGRFAVISVHDERIPVLGLVTKRAIDLAVSAGLLVLLAPVMAAIALLVKLESPGPALYKAARAGRKGRRFLCCKFRTMRNDADQLKDRVRHLNQREGPIFKITCDPRITRVGSILRRYSLDELPQLWNVLKGEMSLVGPRPHPLDDYQRYELEHLRRLDVTPGMTGLWQVTARRDPSFQRNMALDLEYIEQWSLGMDLRILLKTFVAVAAGTGA